MQVRRELEKSMENEMKVLRKKVIAASSAAASSVGVGGFDWSDRRRRLVGWKVGLLKIAINNPNSDSRGVF